ncbi:hypothetical protein L083_3675 [Actinoplanes sp. N902-109]|nr:hypothetical protein L083_3675 [Actinoplanes sp. N902-109]
MPAAAIVVILAQVAGIVINSYTFRISSYTELAVPWVVFVPVLSAIAVGFCLRSPVPQIDNAAVRSLAAWRAGQVAALTIVALIGTTIMASRLTGPISTTAAIRNCLGFTGLALISAALCGARLAWLLPIAWAASAMTLGNPVETSLAWDWPVRTNNDYSAFVIAVLLAATGGAMAIMRGTREREHDL